MTALRSLRLPTRWYAPFSELQALTQLQHLSLGWQGTSGSFSTAVSDLNATLRHCPLRSLVLGHIPFNLSAVDWAACSGTLVSLQLLREGNRIRPLHFEGLPIANAILPALKLLSIDSLKLMIPGDSVAGLKASIAAAVAASPDLCVEVGVLRIENMRAAEVLEVLDPPQNRVHVRRELRCFRVLFESPDEVDAMARLLPCHFVKFYGPCSDVDASATASALRAWAGVV